MPENRLLLDSAIILGKIDKKIIVFIASLASSFGQFVNYYIGVLLVKAIEPPEIKEKNIEKFSSFFNNYAILWGSFSWIPVLGPTIVVLSGYKKLNRNKIFYPILLGNFIYYYIYVKFL